MNAEVVDHSTVCDLMRETDPLSLMPVGHRFTVYIKRSKNPLDFGICTLDAFMKRVGTEKTKQRLGDLAWKAGQYLRDPELKLYKFGVDKLNFLKEVFREKKWPISFIVDRAVEHLAIYLKPKEKATEKVLEVMNLCGNKVGSKKKKDQTPKDQSTSNSLLPQKTKTLNSQLAAEIDHEANRYLMKSRPRGWNADMGKRKEEADKKSTEIMVNVWNILDDPITRTARGGTPVKKCMKKDGLTNASTKASPFKSTLDEGLGNKKGVEPW